MSRIGMRLRVTLVSNGVGGQTSYPRLGSFLVIFVSLVGQTFQGTLPDIVVRSPHCPYRTSRSFCWHFPLVRGCLC